MTDFCSILPELLLFSLTCVVLLISLFFDSKKSYVSYAATLVVLVIVLLLLGHLFGSFSQTSYAWQEVVVVDKLSVFLKLFATLCTILTLVYGKAYAEQRGILNGSYLILLLLALLGVFILISANHLLMVYLGLEMLTLASYALVSVWRQNKLALEAAMKYFVLGALASGFLLYGISMLYGATGSLYMADIALALQQTQKLSLIGIFALVFIVAGIGFKLGVVPFHMWVPDVYHGAPTNITLFVATAPKLAAFAMVFRLLAQTLPDLAFDWQQMLLALAVVSLIVGNLAAIMQTNIKRMLAFSTIAQVAFILLALAAAGYFTYTMAGGDSAVSSYTAALLYLVGYVMTTLVTFGIILLLAKDGFESDTLQDFAGLNQRSQLYAAVMAICMFSLAGIPPLLGFYTKFVVLKEMLATDSTMYLVLAVFAVVMSLIAAFYYLRIVKVMYFDNHSGQDSKLVASLPVKVILAVNGLLILLWGVLPQTLISYCYSVIEQAFL